MPVMVTEKKNLQREPLYMRKVAREARRWSLGEISEESESGMSVEGSVPCDSWVGKAVAVVLLREGRTGRNNCNN